MSRAQHPFANNWHHSRPISCARTQIRYHVYVSFMQAQDHLIRCLHGGTLLGPCIQQTVQSIGHTHVSGIRSEIMSEKIQHVHVPDRTGHHTSQKCSHDDTVRRAVRADRSYRVNTIIGIVRLSAARSTCDSSYIANWHRLPVAALTLNADLIDVSCEYKFFLVVNSPVHAVTPRDILISTNYASTVHYLTLDVDRAYK